MFRTYKNNAWEGGLEIQLHRAFIYFVVDVLDWGIGISYSPFAQMLFINFLCFSLQIQHIEVIDFDPENGATSEELWGKFHDKVEIENLPPIPYVEYYGNEGGADEIVHGESNGTN